MKHDRLHSRREFLAAAALFAAAPTLAQSRPGRPYKIAGFTKAFQHLNFEETADFVAEVGWTGIELPLRRAGHVLPERVDDDLPKMAEALKRRNLEITFIATDIENARTPFTEKILRAAAKLGINNYRLAHLHYDLSRPIPPQIDAFRAGFRELLSLNQELGLRACYQNHSGAGTFGGPVWDVFQTIKDLDPAHYGICFDIAHATIEGGYAWATHFRLVEPILTSVYVKDFAWKKGAKGWEEDWLPLGHGMVNPVFFDKLKKSTFNGPFVQHFEYPMPKGREMLEAMRRDRQTLQSWLDW
jgi:sugar phosphate isomerase/epimerase